LDYGYEVTWDQYMSRGDPAIVYVNKRGFAAVVEVGEKFYDESPIGWSKVYPYRFHIKIKKEGGPLKISSSVRRHSPDSEKAVHHNPNTIDQLVFITDKGVGERGGARWNNFVFPSLVAIPQEDFVTIQSKL
jgi:hypothetical protein